MFIIKDWAGNELTYYGEFESFDLAWDTILSEFPNEKDDFFDDFYVETK